MDKKDIEVKTGVVTEALPNAMFKVRLTDKDKISETEMLAFLSGKMRLNRIRVLIGDTVEMQMDPYGGKARITRRN